LLGGTSLTAVEAILMLEKDHLKKEKKVVQGQIYGEPNVKCNNEWARAVKLKPTDRRGGVPAKKERIHLSRQTSATAASKRHRAGVRKGSKKRKKPLQRATDKKRAYLRRSNGLVKGG